MNACIDFSKVKRTNWKWHVFRLQDVRYPNLQQIIKIKDEAAIDLDASKKSVERRKSKQFVMVSRYL